MMAAGAIAEGILKPSVAGRGGRGGVDDEVADDSHGSARRRGTADAGDNAGENERREREAATAPPPIRLSTIAVARSMVLF